MIPRILLLSCLILALAAGAWLGLGLRPKLPVASAPGFPKLKTERIELSPTRFPVVLKTRGTVVPHHPMTLTSQVAGILSRISPQLETGAFFKKGEILAELETSELEAALINAQSKLAKAEAALVQEEVKAEQGRMNWADLGYTDAPGPLVLRVPQLKEAHANVLAAQAEIGLAQKNLERTKIRAPFDGRVASHSVQPGQNIAANSPLAEIFATDFAEVRLPLSPKQADFVRLPTRATDEPVEVTLIDDFDGNERTVAQTWRARIIRTEGIVNAETKEIFAIARVEDPCGLQNGKPELRLGQPVRANIHGVILDDVYMIPRLSMQGENRIYRINKNHLTLQPLEVCPVWSNEEHVIIRKGLHCGDWIATTRLPESGQGTPVEIVTGTVAAEPEISKDLSGS